MNKEDNKKGIENFLSKIFLIKNNKGWIEVVEAFIAILLVSGVLLILVTQGNFGKTDISSKVYITQISILREIQTNDGFRTKILSLLESLLPIEWESLNFPADIKSKIIQRTPNYLECIAKICKLDDICILSSSQKADVYTQEVTISSTLEIIGYRKFKLFCVEKGGFD